MDDLATRLDRIEATLAIQQLPVRYAMAVDGRDIQAWVDLFISDVDCGRHGKGREALKAFISPTLTGFYRSIHQICGHRIDFIDADHATGAVYCRAEHEDGEHWVVMAICYFDSYERRDGQWFFIRRQEKHWYAADHLSRPGGPDFSAWPDHAIGAASLPGAFPTWNTYWTEQGEEAVKRRSLFPAD